MSDTETTTPRPEKKATVRLGQRELTLISFGVIAVVVLIGLYAGFRVYKGFKSARDVVIAKDNMHTLHTALKGGYAQDWEGKLPKAEAWTDAVLGYLSAPPNKPGGKEAFLYGPGDGEQVRYVYNELASGYNLETGKDANGKAINPRNLVLLIERPGAEPNAHVKIPPQDNGEAQKELYKELQFTHFSDDANNATSVVLFADGSIVTMTRRDFN